MCALPHLPLQLSAEYQSVSGRVLAPCEVCDAQVALSNLQRLMVDCCTKVSCRLGGWRLNHCAQLEMFACLLFCVWSTVSRAYKIVCMYLTSTHILFCIIVSGSGLIITVMERGRLFSGDFLVTFALPSGTTFSVGVWPDVLSSGCVETSVQAPLWKM